MALLETWRKLAYETEMDQKQASEFWGGYFQLEKGIYENILSTPETVVKGTVARMTDFGAFVELAPGVDALLHVSQIAKEHIEKPSDVLSVGQEIEAQIVDFNEEEKKISLSMKALLNADEETETAAEDTVEE